MYRPGIVGVFVLCALARPVEGKVAREVAEICSSDSGPRRAVACRNWRPGIERMAARHGDEAIIAIRKGGPSAGLVEAAGTDGAKAVRVLAVHGEQGASRVLSRPTAMKQFLHYGDDAASVLVRHPGVAEPLIERGGVQAVKALVQLTPQRPQACHAHGRRNGERGPTSGIVRCRRQAWKRCG